MILQSASFQPIRNTPRPLTHLTIHYPIGMPFVQARPPTPGVCLSITAWHAYKPPNAIPIVDVRAALDSWYRASISLCSVMYASILLFYCRIVFRVIKKLCERIRVVYSFVLVNQLHLFAVNIKEYHWLVHQLITPLLRYYKKCPTTPPWAHTAELCWF